MILIALTISAIIWDHYSWKRVQADQMIAFQRMVGGVGMGAISSPVWNIINFDPRIQSVDDSNTWPIPGGYSYGPDRTATVSYFEEIPVNQLLISPSSTASQPNRYDSQPRGEKKPAYR